MDNNNLDNLNMNESNNTQPIEQPVATVAPVEQPQPVTPQIENEAQVVDINNLEYNEILRPGEELDDFHYEKKVEEIDTKFLGTNILAVLSLIFSFFIPLIPIFMALIAIKQIRKTHEGGKPFAIAALIINILILILEVFVSLYVFRIGPFENKMKNISDDQLRICTYKAYGCDSDEDENGFKTCSFCADDDALCNDPKVIECPTDNLLKETERDEKTRRDLNLNN